MSSSPLPPIAKTFPALWRFFLLWFSLGCQSFGGGPATLALIHRAIVERNKWVTEDEFSHDWALCQITPGINLFALMILIGKRVCGLPGCFAALAGLLLPSVTITILITGSFSYLKRFPITDHALSGIIPATVGLGFITAFALAKTALSASRKSGTGILTLSVLILIASGLCAAFLRAPVSLVILAAASLSALARWFRAFQKKETTG